MSRTAGGAASVRALRSAPVVAGLLAALAGCHSGGTTTASATASPPCPSVSAGTASRFAWPAGTPSGLPAVPDGRLLSTEPLSSGLTVYTVRSPGSVRTNLLVALEGLRAGGWAIGRGVDGATESRIPFTRAGEPGVLRLVADGPCATTWILQV